MPERKLRLLSTALSDTGYVRANNQDSGFAGSRILAMADGMGGHAGGDTASTIAIRTLAHVERSEHRGSVLSMSEILEKSILAAHDAIVGRAKREHQLSGMGTTVDTVALTHGWWVLAHIGDSRAYLLRDGHLIRATKDHSYVQHLIDTGRITPEEGRNHPQKNVVMRVLGDFDIDPHPDISVRRAQPGDRWLLCSDGLCGPLEDSTIREIMLDNPDRDDCAQKLVNAALKAGSTDNVTAVIGDAQIAPVEHWSLMNPNEGLQVPLVAGAAVAGIHSIADVVHRPVAAAPKLRNEASPAQKAAVLMGRSPHSEETDDGTPVSWGTAKAAGTGAEQAQDASSERSATSGEDRHPAESHASGSRRDKVSPDAVQTNGKTDTPGNPDSTDDAAQTSHISPLPDGRDSHPVASSSAKGESKRAGEHASPSTVPADSVSESDTTIGDKQELVQPTKADDKTDDEMPDTSEIPVIQKSNGTVTADPTDPAVRKAAKERKERRVAEEKEEHTHHRHLIVRWIVGLLLVLAVGAGGVTAVGQWMRRQYYVGGNEGRVAVYQGVPTNLFGLRLSTPVQTSSVTISSLPKDWQSQLAHGIQATSREDAMMRLREIEKQARSSKTNPKKAAASRRAARRARASQKARNANGSNGNGVNENAQGANGQPNGDATKAGQR